MASPSGSSPSSFAAREPHFAHGSHSLSLLLPHDADEWIDPKAFEQDERLPYWADLWPSARALSRWLIDLHADRRADLVGERIIELGCGATALPSLVLSRMGHAVLAADYEVDALRLVRENAVRNHASTVETHLLDWRDDAKPLGAFDLIIGCDLMYEQRNAIALAVFIPRMLAAGGRMLLADPGRRYLPEFIAGMKRRGYGSIERASIAEPNEDSTKPPSHVRIIEFAAAA